MPLYHVLHLLVMYEKQMKKRGTFPSLVKKEGASMTSTRRSQLDADNSAEQLGGKKRIHLVGALAMAGTLLLMIGISLSYAGVMEDSILPSILRQLKDQGKKIKSTAVVNSGPQSQIIVICANGEERKYDASGQITEIKDAHGNLTLFKDGLVTEERDARGRVTSKTEYKRTPSGKVRESIKRGVNGTETKLYNEDGDVVQTTDSNGTRRFSHYIKDGQGRTLSYQEIDLNTNKATQIILDPKTGEVVEKVDESGARTKVENQRDENDEIVATIERDNNGNVTTKKLKNGQVVESNKNGVVTKYDNVLDANGRLVESREITTLQSSRGPVTQSVVRKFDEAGQVTHMIDRDGEHFYNYVRDKNGKVASRQERIVTKTGGQVKSRTIKTVFDEMGRATSVDDGSKRTVMSYEVDAKGNVTAILETSTYQANGKTYTETKKKIFDGKGNLVAQADGTGKTAKFTNDANGNRKTVKSEDGQTDYAYDQSGTLLASTTHDKKGVTLTQYEKDGKTIARKVKVLNNGFAEITSYSNGAQGERTAVTHEQFGIKHTTFLSHDSEQPKETVFTKYNGKVIRTKYEYVGDHLVSSRETGPDGATDTKYNENSKPESSTRTDKWGRKYITNYQFNTAGKMTTSVERDKKGTTTTQFDKNENPSVITRINKIGFPRKSVEKREYSEQGELVRSVSVDSKGKTITRFDSKGLAAEVKRVNLHGFPRENTVKNEYDAGGEIVKSEQTDNRGRTHNEFDSDGLMTKSVREDIYGFPKKKTTEYKYKNGELINSRTDDDRGVTRSNYDINGLMTDSRRSKKYGFPREEYTTYKYDGDGNMKTSREVDKNGVTESKYNIDALTDVSVRKNKYGHARTQTTKFAYDSEGFMTTSRETDIKGRTDTKYNKDGLATTSTRNERYGVAFGRLTQTTNDYDFEGFLTASHSKNILATTDTEFDRDNLVRKTTQRDNFGLVWGRVKVTQDYVYDGEGHMKSSVERDRLGMTLSKYDIHGDAVETRRLNVTGLKTTRDTVTKSKFDQETGLILGSEAVNKYGVTKTYYDSKQKSKESDGTYGVPVRSLSKNNFGLGAARRTDTKIKTDLKSGLTQYSLGRMTTLDGKIEYGTSESWTDAADGHGRYGIAVRTRSRTNYGLGYTRQNEAGKGVAGTKLEVDENTGLTKRTLAKLSGVGGKGVYGTSESWTDASEGGMYGIAIRTRSTTNYGLGLTRVNEAGKGVAGTKLDVDKETGLTKYTLAKLGGKNGGEYGTSESWTDASQGGTYGYTTHTRSRTNYGLGFTRMNEAGNRAAGTELKVNKNTGLTQYTKAKMTSADGKNQYGISESWTDASQGGTYGIAIRTRSQTKYGLGFTRQNEAKKGGWGMALEVDRNTGLTKYTKARLSGIGGVGEYGTSESWTDATKGGTYGIAIRTRSRTQFGLGFTRQNEAGEGVAGTKLDVDKETGLTKHTLAKMSGVGGKGCYGWSESWTDAYYGGQYGITARTKSTTNYGIGFTRQNEAGVGVGGTLLDVDKNTGLTKHTRAKLTGKGGRGEYGTSESWTDACNGGTYGITTHTKSTTRYGLGLTRRNEAGGNVKGTKLLVDKNTGLTQYTKAKLTSVDGIRQYGTSESWTDAMYGGKYGVSVRTRSFTNFGLGLTRRNEAGKGVSGTSLKVDSNTGLTQYTKAKLTDVTGSGVYGTSESWTDATKGGTYGIAIHTRSKTNYGLGYTRQNEAGGGIGILDVDKNTGLTRHTLAKLTGIGGKGCYGWSESWTDAYYGGTAGVAARTVSKNKFGLGFTRRSEAKNSTKTGDMRLDVDKNTGLTKHTRAKLTDESGKHHYGWSESWTDASQGGTFGYTIHTRSTSNYGLGLTRQNEAGGGKGQLIVDQNTGLTKYTKAVLSSSSNKSRTYGTSESWTDASAGGTYGCTIRTRSISKYGLGFARVNTAGRGFAGTKLDVDRNTGLTKHTLAKLTSTGGQAYGSTETWTDAATGGTYGTTTHTKSLTNFGLGYTRRSEANGSKNVVVDKNTGLTRYTKSKLSDKNGLHAYGTSETWNDARYGVATHTRSINNYGFGYSRRSEAGGSISGSKISVNTDTGLTKYTKAKLTGTDGKHHSGWSESWTDANNGGTYGYTVHTRSTSKYGLGFSRQTEAGGGVGKLQVNKNNGLTMYTKARMSSVGGGHVYGWSESWTDAYNGGTIGFTTHTKTQTYFGLKSMRTSEAGGGVGRLDVDPNTGITLHTKSRLSGGGRVGGWNETWTDKKTGKTTHTISVNNFGLGFTRRTEAKDGVGGMILKVDGNTGLTKHTRARLSGANGTGEYGWSETWTDACNGGTTGKTVHTKSTTNFGLKYSRISEAGQNGTYFYHTNSNTGLMTHSKAKLHGNGGSNGSVESWTDAYNGGTAGVVTHSITRNNHGKSNTRKSDTHNTVDKTTGLTTYSTTTTSSLSGSWSSKTKTNYANGIAKTATVTNRYGSPKTDHLTYTTNSNTGVQTQVYSSNSKGWSRTYNDATYGNAYKSHNHQYKGYWKYRDYWMRIKCNLNTGVMVTSYRTYDHSLRTTTTSYDYKGNPVREETFDPSAVKSAQRQLTTNVVNDTTGQVTKSYTTNSAGQKTTTTYDEETGAALYSDTSDGKHITVFSDEEGITTSTHTTYTDGIIASTDTDFDPETSQMIYAINYYKNGNTFSWTYDRNQDGETPTHAVTKYTNYLSLHNGTGEDFYDPMTGFLQKRILRNTATWNETLTTVIYGADGISVAGIKGTRENGEEVSYAFYEGTTEVVSMADDKGVTTFDGTGSIVKTVGKLGTFTYRGGSKVTSIRLDCAETGRCGDWIEMDQYYNWKTWHAGGQTFTITGAAKRAAKSNYVTQAEFATTIGNDRMTGKINFKEGGFWITGAVMEGRVSSLANLTQKQGFFGASMDKDQIVPAFQKMLQEKYGESGGTFSYTGYDDARNQASTRGALLGQNFDLGDLTGNGYVKYEIGPDGKGTVTYSQLEVNLQNLVWKTRWAPTGKSVGGESDWVTTVPESQMGTWNANKNHAFDSGAKGYEVVVTQTRTVNDLVGSHTEYKYKVITHFKQKDGGSWESDGTTVKTTFGESVTETTDEFQLGPVYSSFRNTQTVSLATTSIQSVTIADRELGSALVIPGSGSESDAGKITANGASDAETGDAGQEDAAEIASVKQTEQVSTSSKKTSGAQTQSDASGEDAKQTGTQSEAAANLQAKLVDVLKSVKGLEDAVKLIQTALARMSGQEILEALKGSSEGVAKLIDALTAAYQVLFGDVYKGSVLGQVLDLVNQSVKLEPVKLAFLGGEALPADVKLAAQKEQAFKNAQNVSVDENGNVVKTVDQGGNTHEFSYDESGVTETITDRQGKISVKHTDKNGRLLSENSEGRSVTYSYVVDDQGKQQTQAQERTAQGLATLLYNDKNQLVSVESNGKKKTFEYEGEGENETVKTTTTDEQGRFLEQKTYKQGRLVETKNQDGSSTKYDYMCDDSGKVLAVTLEITDSDNQKTFLKYNQEGRLVSALGKNANRFEKQDQQGTIAEQVAGFEMGKQLFSDPRMDGMRIDNKMQLQQLQNAPK